MSAPDSTFKKHEDGLSIRQFRSTPFQSPEEMIAQGVETWDVLLNLKGNVAIDVGAHVGAYSMRLARNFRFVYAFEMNPMVYQVLVRNIKENHIENVETIQMGVSDSSGNKTMQASTRWLSAATLAESHYPDRLVLDSKTAVQTVSLDEYFKNGIGKIDLVKIDAENHELAVLKGMARIIEKHRPLMSVEVHKGPTSPEYCVCDICSWLRNNTFGQTVELHGNYADPKIQAHWVVVK